MKIVITSINLGSIRHFFRLSNYARLVVHDLRREEDCIAIRTKGVGKAHYTMSIWINLDSMRKWHISGQHHKVMKVAEKIAVEMSTHTIDGDRFPDWRSAKKMLKEKGKTIIYN